MKGSLGATYAAMFAESRDNVYTPSYRVRRNTGKL